MKMNHEELVTFINGLEGYEGYVQFSNRSIEDVWTTPGNIQIDPKEGFVYEAHFSNGKESLAIRQINDAWLVSTTDISRVPDEDRQGYESQSGRVQMAQIWEEMEDKYCAGMRVKKLSKVVFAGFEKGGAQ